MKPWATFTPTPLSAHPPLRRLSLVSRPTAPIRERNTGRVVAPSADVQAALRASNARLPQPSARPRAGAPAADGWTQTPYEGHMRCSAWCRDDATQWETRGGAYTGRRFCDACYEREFGKPAPAPATRFVWEKHGDRCHAITRRGVHINVCYDNKFAATSGYALGATFGAVTFGGPTAVADAMDAAEAWLLSQGVTP